MNDVMAAIRAKVELRSLVQDLAELTGVPEDEALREALRDRLARLKGPASPEERVAHAIASLRRGCSSRERELAPTDAEWDRALGYGKEGV
jgi:hypothetical protein